MRNYSIAFIIFLICIIFCDSIIIAQSKVQIGIYGGINYGGPLPNSFKDSTSGKSYIGPHFGLQCNIDISKHFSIANRLSYSYSKISYGQKEKKDTLYPFKFNDTTTVMIPTYYSSDLNGTMMFHTLTYSLEFEYKPFKFLNVSLGPYVSLLLSGKDTANNFIIVGDNFISGNIHIDNSKYFKTFDWGLSLNIQANIYKGLFACIRATRSLQNMYQSDYYDNNIGNSAKFYHTYVYLSLGYKIKVL